MTDFTTSLEALFTAEPIGAERTANSAKSHSTTGSQLLDFFAYAGNARGPRKKSGRFATTAKTTDHDLSLFKRALVADPEGALATLFWSRDPRGGAGVRYLFRVAFHQLADQKPLVAARLIPLVAKMGRWDDLWMTANVQTGKAEMSGAAVGTGTYATAMRSHIVAEITAGKPSLLYKWLPRKGTGLKAQFINELMRSLDLKRAYEWRKLLVENTKVVETLMCAGAWDEIDYRHVPSVANLRYKNAFKRHDVARFEAFVEAASKGEVQRNAAVLYPHQIVEKVMAHDSGLFGNFQRVPKVDRDHYNSLWINLKDYPMPEGCESRLVIPVADTSGSMFSAIGSDKVSPISISVALAIYLAERNTGPFKDKFITFHTTPAYFDIPSGASIVDKVGEVSNAPWGGSTNIQGVFDLILKTGVKNHLSQEDMPEVIVIISDMQFDYCGQNTNLKEARKKFKAAGYELPKIVFWNVSTYGSDYAAKEHKTGVVLLSGASPSVIPVAVGALLSDELPTPTTVMEKTLAPYRQAVREVLN